MFWGLIMEPNRRYSQTVEKSFHVSMASLDSSTADDKIVQVMLYYDDHNYLLCSLQKGQTWQVPLDLNFEEGTKIAFTSNGCGHVHLTGYLVSEDNLDLDDMEEGSEEEEDEEEIPQLISGQPKRKAQEPPKNAKSAKRSKAVIEQEESSDEDDDAESDDEDEDSPKINGGANEEDDSDDLEDGDDDEEDDLSEDEDDEEEEEVKVEVKPQSKKQKQQQKEQQQLTKKEKQKLANGKDAKQEQTSQQQKKGKPEQQQQQKKIKGEQPQQQQQQKKSKAEQQQQQQVQKKRTVEGGVQVEDIKVGTGAPAKSGKFVSVYYVGRLTNGKKFDSTTQGDGFKFRLGKGEVIKGWDTGISGMKIGGKRRITIPPGMAYGAKGSPPVIPGNSTLIFEVELKNVN